jgi:hypothetical protein
MSKRKPNLFVVGSMKAGTTSLARYLGAHPEIFMTSDPKEPTYFLTREQLLDVLPGVEKRGFWRGEEYYLKLFEAAGDRTVVGEASANYARLPRVPGVAEKIHAFNPQARILFILRDPVARTISHYWYMVRFFGERRDLMTAIREDPDYVETSDYAMQMRPYLALFGRERVLAITTEALSTEPRPRWPASTLARRGRAPSGPNLAERANETPDVVTQVRGTRPAASLPTFGAVERVGPDDSDLGARARAAVLGETRGTQGRWIRLPHVATCVRSSDRRSPRSRICSGANSRSGRRCTATADARGVSPAAGPLGERRVAGTPAARHEFHLRART